VILPGGTIGLIGGGQLGRMFGIAARRMGYRVHAMDPAMDCPAGQVADVEINRPYDDIDAARNFANRVDVVTFEFENVPAETLEAIEGITPVRPRPEVLHICRHRLREKSFLRQHRFPHADWREARLPQDLAGAVEDFGGQGILKTALFGYDGKGQQKLAADSDFDEAWKALNQPVGVVERIVPFDMEISAIIARGQDGASTVFPIGRNEHARHILDVTTVPAGLPARVLERAAALGREVAEALDVVGLMAVEMFVVGDDLLINELAPRTHNSGHWTFDACVTSQFEQQLRAVCGLPLGNVAPTAPGVAMANLLGDLWQDGEPDWAAALAFPNVKLHLYGKQSARPGRKMGHLVATAATPEEARRDVLAARGALARG
jgi:5-(carboxyamino)imidazole ribonucleotide synthase